MRARGGASLPGGAPPLISSQRGGLRDRKPPQRGRALALPARPLRRRAAPGGSRLVRADAGDRLPPGPALAPALRPLAAGLAAPPVLAPRRRRRVGGHPPAAASRGGGAVRCPASRASRPAGQ